MTTGTTSGDGRPRIFPSLLLPFLMLLPIHALAEDLNGRPEIIDGGTLAIGGQPIRLFGIAAPRADQVCGPPGGEWNCGAEAVFALAFEAAPHWVTCSPRPGERAGEALVALCRAGPYDLGEKLLRLGWATALAEGGPAYAAAEAEARAAGRGMWRGTAAPPAPPQGEKPGPD